MPMTPRPSVVRTDADGLAAFQGDALLVLEISKREIETGNIASALERLHAIAECHSTPKGHPQKSRPLNNGFSFVLGAQQNLVELQHAGAANPHQKKLSVYLCV